MSEAVSREETEMDDQLVARARGGDMAALETLLTKHQDRVYRTAMGLVGGNDDAAREVAQEVLVSAFRHIGQFRGESRFTTWLYRMTVNFSKNRAVATGRHRARFVSLEAQPEGQGEDAPVRQYRDPGVSPREQAAGKEMHQLMMERMGELPEEFRIVLVLRYIEDRSYDEIADALAVPIGTIKSRINRGRAELRRLMTDVLEVEDRR